MARGNPGAPGQDRGEHDAAPATGAAAVAPETADESLGAGRPAEGATGDGPPEAVQETEAGPQDDVDELRLVDQTADESQAERLRRIRLENLAKGRQAGRKRKTLRQPGRPRRVTVTASEDDERPKAMPRVGGNGITRQDVGSLLDIVEGLITPQLGPEAAFNARERGLIEPSLARIMARMTPGGAAVFGALADPVLLGAGLLMWGLRLSASRQQQRPPIMHPTMGPFPPREPPAAANGHAPIRTEAPPVPVPPGEPDPNGVAHPEGLQLGGI